MAKVFRFTLERICDRVANVSEAFFVKYKGFFTFQGLFSQIFATEVLNSIIFKISIANICENQPEILKNTLYFAYLL